MRQIVVVGGSLAGLRAAQALRKRGYDGKLVVVGDEPHAPYDRPPLSKQLLRGDWPEEKLFFGAKENHDALAIDWRLGQRASALDVRAKRVLLGDATAVEYDGLIIATGARPRTLPQLGGFDALFTLRTLDDARALRARLTAAPKVLIVGAGFIGLEVAASCRALGLEVHVVEPQPLPLLDKLGPQVAQAVRDMHAAHGVTLHLGARVDALEGGGDVERALLSNGRSIEANVVVVGIGVVPETRWLEGSGVALGDGVLCDATLATNVEGVVAAGDVVRWPNPFAAETMRVEHWSCAVEQGQAAAARLLDGPAAAQPFAHVPYFWSDQYKVKLQCAGSTAGSDAFELVDGALEQPEAGFVVLYGRGGRLQAVLACNRPAHFLRYRKLLSERASFEAACRAR